MKKIILICGLLAASIALYAIPENQKDSPQKETISIVAPAVDVIVEAVNVIVLDFANLEAEAPRAVDSITLLMPETVREKATVDSRSVPDSTLKAINMKAKRRIPHIFDRN